MSSVHLRSLGVLSSGPVVQLASDHIGTVCWPVTDMAIASDFGAIPAYLDFVTSSPDTASELLVMVRWTRRVA